MNSSIGAEPAALREARRVADEVLFPDAVKVDEADRVPTSHLDLLAEEGFYGLAAPEDMATLDMPDFPSVLRLVEILAGGCLTTTFVWIQHHGLVLALGDSRNTTLRDVYLADLTTGQRRAGMAIGSAIRPGPPSLRAERVDGGYVFDGAAPWVTGWGMIDVLYTAGRDADDVVVGAVLDATESETISVEPLSMLAVQASRTVTVRFARHFVPDERVITTQPQAEYLRGDAESLRFTGTLSLGVAERAITLLDSDAGGLAAELNTVRANLLAADAEQVPVARAAGSELAMRATSAYAVSYGSKSLLPDGHAQRLVREATFLLLFGSRPGIRAALLEQLTAPRHGR